MFPDTSCGCQLPNYKNNIKTLIKQYPDSGNPLKSIAQIQEMVILENPRDGQIG